MSTIVLRNGFKNVEFFKTLTKEYLSNAFILNYEK
jgi:hypothetical protein